MIYKHTWEFRVCAIGLVLLGFGCKEEARSPMIGQEKAVTIARTEAQKLGYPLHQMTVSVTRTGDVFAILFLPPEGRLGGDLTVKIDATHGKIMETLRGQ
jgi:hypothetical protein